MDNQSVSEVSECKRVFLLDAGTEVESQILEKWVRQNRKPDSDIAVVLRSLRAGRYSPEDINRINSVITDESDIFFIPVRVVWQRRAGSPVNKGISIKDILFGNYGNPGPRRQKLLYRKAAVPGQRTLFEVVSGEGASLSDLRARCEMSPLDIDFPRFIARSALLALELSERSIKGVRYKVPRTVYDEVLGKPQLKQMLDEMSAQTGRSEEDLHREAAACLKEMAATPTPAGIDLAAALGRYMYTRGFNAQIDISSYDLSRIQKFLGERPVAFLFTHKSHIDGFLLITLFHDLNLPPLHTFGGINMGFLGLGTILRNAGAIFIRRTFKGDEIYKAVFKSYIDYLGEKRFPVMWALEGTRSRTGKLMPPRFGLLNYVVSAYLRDNAPDLMLMPISIVYDQIPEVTDYDLLQAGGVKRPESVSWFMQYIKGLKRPNGRIHVRFGQGVSISQFVKMDAGVQSIEMRDMQKIAFELAVDVNKATVVTLNSLITYVLLEQGHRAITFNQLAGEIRQVIEFVRLFDFPMTSESENFDADCLSVALRQLAANGVITAAEGGMQTVYMIPYGKARTAAYYRNGLIHFFITSAIGEVALLAVTETGEKGFDQFRQEALRIRDLLKYEFFFEGSDKFLELLEHEFDTRCADWRSCVDRGSGAIQDLLRNLDINLGHGTLRPFIESYLVFSKVLAMAPPNEEIDEKKLIANALALGKQKVLQQRIHCEESVSKNYFENAVMIAKGKNLFEMTETALQGRQQLLEELREITANVRFLASVADARRLTRVKAGSDSEL